MKTAYHSKLLALYLGIWTACMPMRVTAEDIDIFTGASAGTSSNPNILIVLDNSANWSRQSQQWPGGIVQGQAEADAIKTVLTALNASGKGANVNIGLMEYGSSYAGYIRRAIKTMQDIPTATPPVTNVTDFNTQLTTIYNNINTPSEKVPQANWYGDLMYDAYNYFAGRAPVWAQLGGASGGGVGNNPDVSGYLDSTYTQFVSPVSGSTACARNFIIFIGNPAQGGPKPDTAANSCALYKLTYGTTTCPSGNFTPQLGLPNFTLTGTPVPTTIGQSSECLTATQYSSINAAIATCLLPGTNSSCYYSTMTALGYDPTYVTATTTNNDSRGTLTPPTGCKPFNEDCKLGAAVANPSGSPMACPVVGGVQTKSYSVLQTSSVAQPSSIAATVGTPVTTSSSTTACYTSQPTVTATGTSSSLATAAPLNCPIENIVYSTLADGTRVKTDTTHVCTYAVSATPAAACAGIPVTSPAAVNTTSCYTSSAGAQTATDTGTLSCAAGYTCSYAWGTPTTLCPTTSTTSYGTTTSCYGSSTAATAAITATTSPDIGGMTCPTTPLDAFGNPPVCSYALRTPTTTTACSANVQTATSSCLAAAPAANATTASSVGLVACPTNSTCTYTVTSPTDCSVTDPAGVTTGYYASTPAASVFPNNVNNTASAVAETGTNLSCPANTTCSYSVGGISSSLSNSSASGVTTNKYQSSTTASTAITAGTDIGGMTCPANYTCSYAVGTANTSTAPVTSTYSVYASSAPSYASVSNSTGSAIPLTGTTLSCPSLNDCSYGVAAGTAVGNGGTVSSANYKTDCQASIANYTYSNNTNASVNITTWTDSVTHATVTLSTAIPCAAYNVCVISNSGGSAACSGSNSKFVMGAVETGMVPYTVTQTATPWVKYNIAQTQTGMSKYTVTQKQLKNTYTITQSEAKNQYGITQTSGPASTNKYTVTQTLTQNNNKYTVTQTDTPTVTVTTTPPNVVATTNLGQSTACYASAPTYPNPPAAGYDYASSCTNSVPLWVSGTTYAVGDSSQSPIDNTNYTRLIAGAGTLDPSLDTVNWRTGSTVSCAYASGSASTTTNQCPAGTNQYNVDGIQLTQTVGPNGTFTTDTAVYNADEWAKLMFQKGVPVSFGASLWTSGATYNVGNLVQSPLDLKTYACIQGVTGIIDPSLDTANWVLANASNATISTYTIDVYNAQPDNQETGLYMSMAKNGGGKYYKASSEADIAAALNAILAEIQSVNSTFASASLPVNATNRTQNANQVFVGMFRPDPNAGPRWFGNLKQYQIGTDGVAYDIYDNASPPKKALNGQTGFVNDCAISFWSTDSPTPNSSTYPWLNNIYITPNAVAVPPITTSQTDFYWNNIQRLATSPAGTCVSNTTYSTSLYSDLTDGPFVEKGAAAEVLRKGNDPSNTTPTWSFNRNMYTLSGGALVAYDSTNSGLSTDAFHYTQGKDVNGDCGGGTNPVPCSQTTLTNWSSATNIMRPTVHGDVIHSRPLPVNFGTTASPNAGVTAFYGANDGTFRAVVASGSNAGKELWAFVAPEFAQAANGRNPGSSTDPLTRLMNNSPQVSYPGMTGIPKDYFFDGSAGIYQNLDNSQVWIYPSMRRGGRMIYSFEVKDSAPNSTSTTPVAFKWRAGCPSLNNDTGCTAGMAGIGQTWSMPTPVPILKPDMTVRNVVVVGGGYDNCEDADTSTPACSSGKGHVVYMLDADTGGLIATFTTNSSVIADPSFIDVNNDGNVDYCYVLDTGGNVYRINFADPTSNNAALDSAFWTIQRIAYTSGGGRKFQWAPAVLPNNGKVYMAFASGDREHPLISNYPYKTPVSNRLYVYLDDMARTNTDLDGAMMSNFNTDPGCTGLGIDKNGKYGWYMDFTGRGEQAVTSAVIQGGMISVSTNRPIPPAAGTCSSALGEARGYWVNLFNASGAMQVNGSCGGSRFGVFAGGGLPPSPVFGTVPVNGVATAVLIGAIQRQGGSSSGMGVQPVPPPIKATRKILYWKHSGDN